MRYKRIAASIIGAVLMLNMTVGAWAEPAAEDPSAFSGAGKTLANGLVLHATFDDDDVDGDVLLDKSGRGNNGHIAGSPERIEGVNGGTGFLFKNTAAGNNTGEQYVNYGKPADLQFGTGDFSFSFWVKVIDNGRNDCSILGNKNYSSGSNLGYVVGHFSAQSPADIRINLTSTQGSRAEVKDINVSDGEWHHIAAVFDRGGSLTAYVDGVASKTVNAASQSGSVDSGLDFVLGADGNFKYPVNNIALDELLVYNRTLTAGEVAALYSLAEIPAPEPEPEPGDGLVLHTSFEADDISGNTLLDLSGRGNDGAIVGSPALVDGVDGTAMYFSNPTKNSASQYINFGKPADLQFGTRDFAYTFWVKTTPGTTKNDSIILGNKNYDDGNNRGYMSSNWDTGLYANMSLGTTKREVTGIKANDGNWHHVAVSYDRQDAMKVYVDGEYYSEADISIDSAGSVDSGLDFRLACDPNGKYAINGVALDEVRVYNRTISAEEVGEIYELHASNLEPIPEPHTGLVLYASFDEEDIEDGKLLDGSGRDNHGTIVGSPELIEGVNGGTGFLFKNTASGNNTGSQYVNYGLADDLQFGTGDFSYAFWVKVIDRGRNDCAILGNKNYGNGSNLGYVVGHFAPGATTTPDIRINLSSNGSTRAEIKDVQVSDGEWHHVAATYNRAGSLTVYVDGAVVQTVGITGHSGSVNSGLPFVLGADGNFKYPVNNIALDELYMYNSVLSADDVQTLYLEGTGYESVLDEYIEKVKGLPLGSQYTQELIDGFLAYVEEVRIALEGADVPTIITLLAELRERYDTLLLGAEANITFFLTSDPHINGAVSASRQQNYITGLLDMAAVDPDAAAFISGGDNTQDSYESEYASFYEILRDYAPVDNDRMLIALGNHDVRGPSSVGWYDPENGDNRDYQIPYWDTTYERYMRYNEPYMPDTDGKTYYDRWIDGYHFIVINTEASLKDRCYLTQEQIEWLDEKLAENYDPSKPKFVTIHQSLNETHWRSNIYGGFGSQDADVKAVLAKYPNTVTLTGHIHNGVSVIEAIDRPYGTTVEIPAYTSSENGLTNPGHGYYVKVYDDEVVFKVRNFLTGTWLPEYDITIRTNGLPSVYADAKALDKEDYTGESWAPLAAAMAKAEAVFAKEYDTTIPNSTTAAPGTFLFHADTRAGIETIIDELEAALASLEEKPVDPGPDPELVEIKESIGGDVTFAKALDPEGFSNYTSSGAADIIAEIETLLTQEDLTKEALLEAKAKLNGALLTLRRTPRLYDFT